MVWQPGRGSSERGRSRPLATDLERYYAKASGGHSLLGKVRFWIFHNEFRCVAVFRLDQAVREVYARGKLRGFWPLVFTTLMRRRMDTVHHFHIDPRAQIGPGLMVVHRNGVRIGPVAVGKNLVVNHNVTIGKRLAAGDKGLPRLGDNVWIGPGATLSGDITVGDNVTISAGTVLSKSVPDGCLVAGNPGRILAQDYANRGVMGTGEQTAAAVPGPAPMIPPQPNGSGMERPVAQNG